MSQWHYKLAESEHGPVSFAELVGLVRAGTITETVLVRRATGDTWARAWTIPMLFAAANPSMTDTEVRRPFPEARSASRGPSADDEARRAIATEHAASLPGALRGGRQSALGGFRWAFTAAVSLTATWLLYRESYWRTLTFPRPVRPGEHAADFVFPLVGHCTAAQCVLLYLDCAVAVGAVAWCLFRWVERRR